MSNEMIVKENGGYLTEAVDLVALFSDEMEGLKPTFERIKIPAGGGISYEVPGDDPASPDTAKESRQSSSTITPSTATTRKSSMVVISRLIVAA